MRPHPYSYPSPPCHLIEIVMLLSRLTSRATREVPRCTSPPPMVTFRPYRFFSNAGPPIIAKISKVGAVDSISLFMLVESSPCVDDCGSWSAGNRALHYASLCGHVDVLRALVERASLASLFAKNKDGHSPLHLACVAGHLQGRPCNSMLVCSHSSRASLLTCLVVCCSGAVPYQQVQFRPESAGSKRSPPQPFSFASSVLSAEASSGSGCSRQRRLFCAALRRGPSSCPPHPGCRASHASRSADRSLARCQETANRE